MLPLKGGQVHSANCVSVPMPHCDENRCKVKMCMQRCCVVSLLIEGSSKQCCNASITLALATPHHATLHNAKEEEEEEEEEMWLCNATQLTLSPIAS